MQVSASLPASSWMLSEMNPEQLLEEGERYRQCGEVFRALLCYEAALGRLPEREDVRRELELPEAGQGDATFAELSAIPGGPAGDGVFPRCLGRLALSKGDWEAATSFLQKAVDLQPGTAETYYLLGRSLRATGRGEAAIGALRKAVLLAPRVALYQETLGNALREGGDVDGALEAYDQALRSNPHLTEVRFHRAASLLCKGLWSEGWSAFEARRELSVWREGLPEPSLPAWDGICRAGRVLRVQAEPGLENTIQFYRFLSWLTERGCRPVLACQEPLHRLFAMQPEVGRELSLCGFADPAEQAEAEVPLLSLPRFLGLTPATLPRKPAYLSVDRALVTAWRQVLGPSSLLRVGLAWSSDPLRAPDPGKRDLLKRLKGVSFLALPGCGEEETGSAADMPVPPGEVKDCADLAAVLLNLDLVIASDGPTAHLAGALGKPVWVMIPHVPDWRWMRQRSDTPWYPGMRLFRQTRSGEWENVMDEMTAHLRRLAQV
ncbi:MAG: glycosyltransferase family protein [Magnetococcales bacterium]|nr:glycosyltransferase family protein [Magnetococcales bacterium]